MGKYDGWKLVFADLRGSVQVFDLTELEKHVQGNLPPSARKYQAWWSGQRYYAFWQDHGWTASLDERHGRVRFHRSGGRASPSTSRTLMQAPELSQDARRLPGERRLVLVGCVKSKVRHAAPAKALYDSPLWRKRRAYAEATGMPWGILSAEHGLVDPETVLEPYDRYLGSEPIAFRKNWSIRTANHVLERLRELDIDAVEVHAGAAYLQNGLGSLLSSEGVSVTWPVEGLSIGRQLGWYV